MTTAHAIVHIDHERAQVLQFDAAHVAAGTVKAQTHPTRQHGSAVRTEHEFFAHVADALAGIDEVLVVGPGPARSAFKAYCDKHRPQTARHIVATEASDHPTQAQLVALARRYFTAHDRMAGRPTPS